ncbi:MAG: metallophosphatase domain-containing protein [Methylomicrobium sp.]|nr:metallophosphatase domain-containing protein [Methylomicrobium sp.]
MRIVCLSDTHGMTDRIEIPDGDVLVAAGDICLAGYDSELKLFDEFMLSLPHKTKFLVAGNHDWPIADGVSFYFKRLIKNVIYLEDRGVEIDGVKFWGSPWQPEFFNWAFNLPRGLPLAQMWSRIPDDTDVLITHTPPYGILDQIYSGEAVGCEDLLHALERIQPKLHIFGHIHEGYGVMERKGTIFVNASICDAGYEPVNAPIVIDL